MVAPTWWLQRCSLPEGRQVRAISAARMGGAPGLRFRLGRWRCGVAGRSACAGSEAFGLARGDGLGSFGCGRLQADWINCNYLKARL